MGRKGGRNAHIAEATTLTGCKDGDARMATFGMSISAMTAGRTSP